MLYVAPIHGTGKSTDRPSPPAERREHRRGRPRDEELRPVPARRSWRPLPGRGPRAAGGRAPRGRTSSPAPAGSRAEPPTCSRARRSTRTCATALGPAVWTCGTTSRVVEGRPRLDPRELAAEVARRSAHGEVAIVFGRGAARAVRRGARALPGGLHHPDRAGVRLDEPRPGRGRARLRDRHGRGACLRRRARRRSPRGTRPLEALWDRLRTLLGAAGYLNPQNPEHILADWRRLLARAEPTQREVELVARGGARARAKAARARAVTAGARPAAARTVDSRRAPAVAQLGGAGRSDP